VWNLSLEDVESGTGRVLQRKYCKVSDLGSSKCTFDTRHVLYSKLRPYLNKVVVPDCDGVGTSELIPLLPNATVLDRDFLAFYLRSPQFLEFSESHTRGANLPRIAMDDFWKHKVPTPPLLEQQRLVANIKDMLGNVQEICTLRKEATLESAALFASLLSQAYAKIEPEVGYFTIGSVTLESRYGTNNKCDSDPAGIPILRIPNIANGLISTEDLKFCELTEREHDILRLKDGDLLIVRTNGSPDLVGRCAVFRCMDRQFGFASYLIRFRLDESKVEPQFLAFFLESTKGRDAIASIRKTSAGQFNVNSENLQAIQFPCPPLAVQKRMVEEMFAQRQLVDQIQDRMSVNDKEAVALQQAILRKAFAGEL
jgi:type I restriction enzyme S subunit